jgi:hypothetical protein
MRTKLLNLNTMFSEWNNNAFIDDEFPMALNKNMGPGTFRC